MTKPATALCYASLDTADLDRASALFADLRRFHPDWRYVAVVTGDLPAGAATGDGFEIVRAGRTEFMDRACREAVADIIIHLDPRAVVSASLAPLLQGLDGHDVLLLARINQPAADRQAVLDRDLHIARTGTFNIGFLAVRTSGTGLAFAAWWADRVENSSDGVAPDGYADQRWCDLAPGLFDRVVIVREAPEGLALPLDRDPSAFSAAAAVASAVMPISL